MATITNAYQTTVGQQYRFTSTLKQRAGTFIVTLHAIETAPAVVPDCVIFTDDAGNVFNWSIYQFAEFIADGRLIVETIEDETTGDENMQFNLDEIPEGDKSAKGLAAQHVFIYRKNSQLYAHYTPSKRYTTIDMQGWYGFDIEIIAYGYKPNHWEGHEWQWEAHNDDEEIGLLNDLGFGPELYDGILKSSDDE